MQHIMSTTAAVMEFPLWEEPHAVGEFLKKIV